MSLQKALLMAACMGIAVQAQNFNKVMSVYQLPGCRADSADYLKHDLIVDGDDPSVCRHGFIRLDESWPTDTDGSYKVFYNSVGIGAGCKVAICEISDRDPSLCGNVKNIIDGDNPGDCVAGNLPPDYGFALCCNDYEKCAPVFPPNVGKRIAPAVKDVTEIKRAPLERKLAARDECKFQPDGGVYESQDPAVVVSDNSIDCPAGPSACTYSNSTAVTVGSSNSFAAGTSVSNTAGAIFEMITVEVSFTYTYEYSQSRTEMQQQVITIPPGQKGVIVFTQYTECVNGQFVGDCGDDILVNKPGTACIPVEKAPYGELSFLREG